MPEISGRRRAAARRTARLVALAGLVPLLLFGCKGGSSRVQPPGSAVWLAAGETLQPSQASALAAAGIGEVFVESARLVPFGGETRVEISAPATLPGRAAVTLAIDGELPPGADPERAAKAIAASLQTVRRDREDAGWVVRGVHLDLDATVDALAALAAALREELPDDLPLSVAVGADLPLEPAKRLAKATDFLVPYLYGQRPGAADVPDRWDLEAVARAVATLETLGEPYLVGVVTLGGVSVVDRARTPLGATAAVPSLATLLGDPRFEIQPGFSLAGADRQIYVVRARTRAKLGAIDVPPGAEVRLSRLASAHLRRLRERLAEEKPKHLLGELFWRLPRAGEGLSLTPGNLVAAFGSEPPRPVVSLAVAAAERRRAGATVLRVQLRNDSDEPSDYSELEHNYVELVARRGSFRAAEPGGFARAELLAAGPDGTLVPTYRAPDHARLHLPLLLGRTTVESGDVELVGGDAGDVDAVVDLLLPDGEVVRASPRPPAPAAGAASSR